MPVTNGNNSITYFSADVNQFMIKYSQITDSTLLFEETTILLAHYNQISQLLFPQNIRKSHVRKEYLDELYKLAYDYYQKLYFLTYIKFATLDKSLIDPNFAELIKTLRNTLQKDLNILKIRLYLQENVDLHEIRSFLEIHQIETFTLQQLLHYDPDTLVIDYRRPEIHNKKHIKVNNTVNLYPNESMNFLDLTLDIMINNGYSQLDYQILLKKLNSQNIVICIDSSIYNELIPLFVILVRHFISNDMPIPLIQSCVVDFNQWNILGGTFNETPNTNPFKDNNLKITVGLENEFNSCYMNCIIQCLLPIDDLTSRLLNNSYLNDIDYSNKLSSKGKIISSLASLVQKMFRTSANNMNRDENNLCSCLKLKQCCGSFSSMFNSNREEDSHEFCQFLLNNLHEELKKGTEITVQPQSDAILRTLEGQAYIAWNSYLKTENNFIVDLFQGQIASILQCQFCQYQSINFQIFSTLSLSLPLHTTCDIHDCLNQFCRVENLIGQNEWDCSNCKIKRPATKKLQITKLPKTLIIQLNRFNNDLLKNDCFVQYPYEIDFSRYVLGNYSTKYKLISVACHTGSMHKGHYSSYVRRGYYNWTFFDDTQWRPLNFANEAISQDAYLLFYSRI